MVKIPTVDKEGADGEGGNTVFFARCPPVITVEELQGLFSKFGTVTDINLFKRWASARTSKGCGTVTFAAQTAAAAALKALNGKHTFPESKAPIVVEWLDKGRRHPAKGESSSTGLKSQASSKTAAQQKLQDAGSVHTNGGMRKMLGMLMDAQQPQAANVSESRLTVWMPEQQEMLLFVGSSTSLMESCWDDMYQDAYASWHVQHGLLAPKQIMSPMQSQHMTLQTTPPAASSSNNSLRSFGHLPASATQQGYLQQQNAWSPAASGPLLSPGAAAMSSATSAIVGPFEPAPFNVQGSSEQGEWPMVRNGWASSSNTSSDSCTVADNSEPQVLRGAVVHAAAAATAKASHAGAAACRNGLSNQQTWQTDWQTEQQQIWNTSQLNQTRTQLRYARDSSGCNSALLDAVGGAQSAAAPVSLYPCLVEGDSSASLLPSSETLPGSICCGSARTTATNLDAVFARTAGSMSSLLDVIPAADWLQLHPLQSSAPANLYSRGACIEQLKQELLLQEQQHRAAGQSSDSSLLAGDDSLRQPTLLAQHVAGRSNTGGTVTAAAAAGGGRLAAAAAALQAAIAAAGVGVAKPKEIAIPLTKAGFLQIAGILEALARVSGACFVVEQSKSGMQLRISGPDNTVSGACELILDYLSSNRVAGA